MDRDPDRLGLVRDRTLAGLADPPGRVGRELEALAPVELLDGAVQSDHALLDEVAELQAVALVALRDRDDEAQVGVDHPLLRGGIAALDAFGEVHLVGRGQQLVAAGRVHEELERIEGARRCRRVTGLRRRFGAHDDVALLERGP